ncbi:MAG: response regulator [Nitriliruptorales bacterium]
MDPLSDPVQTHRVEPDRVITLMLVEDHASFRAALEAVFGLQDDLRVVAQVGRGDAAGDAAAEHLPDVAIVDLDLPGSDGVAAIAAIRRSTPATACLVLTALSDDVELGRAIEAGAAAIVHKSAEISELLDAVRAVARGVNLLDPGEISRRLRVLRAARETRWQAQLLKANLTTREKEVLELLLAGRSNRAIGKELGISGETVQTHVRNLLAKLKVGSRLEAVTEAIRLGLVEVPGREVSRVRGDGQA